MEFRISSLLSLILLCNSQCIISSRTEHSDIHERSSQQSPETLSQTNHQQVRPENSIHIHSGETLVLQCRDEGNEGEQHNISFFLYIYIYLKHHQDKFLEFSVTKCYFSIIDILKSQLFYYFYVTFQF